MGGDDYHSQLLLGWMRARAPILGGALSHARMRATRPDSGPRARFGTKYLAVLVTAAGAPLCAEEGALAT